MKFKTLNNKEVRLEILPQRYPMRSRDQCKSIGQYLLGRTIRSIYGTNALILEEFPIPEENLWLDFYMPHHNLAFEFHGEQHDQFNKFFHGDKDGFQRSKARDQRKRDWCILNGITLIEVRENVSSDDFKILIQQAREKNE
jgi:hypothetical protein